MPISSIHIKNCKSLKNVALDLSTFTCLVGENGSGKTNFFRTLLFFHNNLVDNKQDLDLFDKLNPYLDFIEINVTYNLTKIIRIARNNLMQNPSNLHSFFRRILYDLRPKLNSKNELTLQLKYFKDGKKEWNYEQPILNLIKYLFPIIHIPARHIKLTDWDIIWDTIGEITNSSKLLKEQIGEELMSMFDEKYKESLAKDISYIKEEFKNNNIHLAPFTSKQMVSHLIQLEIRGKKFMYKEEQLDYFSDGINSNNYLRLLLSLINRIQSTKLFQPIVIIDEPEVGLHPKLTDELLESFAEKSNRVNVIMATHSPRVVKNIIGSPNGSLFHVSLNEDYSIINKMKTFTTSRETTIVTENEASYYFSRGILFVEGATELELFTNKKLLTLFPILKQIDIFSFDSNSVKLNLIHPKENNTNIPYLVLLDLDKIIKYENGKFIISGDKKYNPFKNEVLNYKENFFFGRKRYLTLNQRRRIEGILHSVNFTPSPDWRYIIDPLFEELKLLIKNYCNYYNFFPVETTIEGSLVNSDNMDIFIQWLLGYKLISPNILFSLLNQSPLSQYKITILRLLVNGKFDNLEKINKEIKASAHPDFQKSLNHIATLSIKKTDGWVSDFLTYYLEEYLADTNYKVRNFARHFPELYAIIKHIETMMKKIK